MLTHRITLLNRLRNVNIPQYWSSFSTIHSDKGHPMFQIVKYPLKVNRLNNYGEEKGLQMNERQ